MQPRWRHDGRELFYIEPDNRLVSVPIQPYAQTQTIEGGRPALLFTMPFAVLNNAQPAYGITPEGRFMVDIDTKGLTASPITIVQNWMKTAVKK